MHPRNAPQVTRKRLVVATLVSFAAVGLGLATAYFFLPVVLGRPVSASFVVLVGVVLLPVIAHRTYRNFRRYAPGVVASQRALNWRAIGALAFASLFLGAGALAGVYLMAHQALYTGAALAVAASVAQHFLVRRLRKELRG